MARYPNIDDLSDDELAEYLNNTEEEDLKADETEEDEDTNNPDAIIYKDEEEKIEIVNETKVSAEIDMLPPKDRKRILKEERKQEYLIEKERKNEIRKRRKALLNEPSKLVRYDTDPQLGLPSDIVNDRIIDGLVNETQDTRTRPIWKIILTNFLSFFNILMFFIAGMLISVGAYLDLTFLLIVLANVIISIIQEIRAKKIIDNLSLLNSPTAIVRRDGVNHEIAVKELVLDDLMLLDAGRQICADSILVEGSVEVNESLLSGESEAIVKNPGDLLYSGSFVISGRCSAKVDKVGKDNYIEKLSDQAKMYKKPKSDLLKSLNRIIQVMSVPVIVLGVSLFFIMYLGRDVPYVTSIRKTAGAMIGMIPSGLFLTSSIALTLSVIRLAQKKVLVQELYCIEMLARVNCICLDKTGTITDGTMVVKNVIDYNSVHGLATKNIISAMLNALEDTNLTSNALKEKFGLGKRIKHVAAIPFSSQRKYQAVTFDRFGTFILGAPEFVLRSNYEKYKNDINKYAQLGFRVLCLAYRDGKIENGELPNSEVLILSMILIEDTIRPDAINTIKYFKDSGVEVKVISGDNPITVSKISQRAGIDNADKYISLDGMSDSDIIKCASKYTVFGRVSPAQKRLLVHTLKEEGKTVAMTGDGVNDILALREADCSIAVASGSDAARNCSHLVLLDSNFDSMPSVVSEGRRVINNITKVSSLFLTKTIFSLFLAIQALIMGTYPIQTNQLFLIDTLSIGIPSLVLINEPNNNPVKGKFIFNVVREALPGALTILMISIIVFSLRGAIYIDDLSLTTIIIVAATHTCLMVLFNACKPFNTIRKALFIVCYTIFLFAVTVLPQLFELRPIFGFAEYHSTTIEEQIITYYPSVGISKNNYYVIDDRVSELAVDNNSTTTTLTAAVDDDGNIYYAINGDRPYYLVDSTKVYFKIDIPKLSYDAKGNIYIGGYTVNDIYFNDDISEQIEIDESGYLWYYKKNTDGSYVTDSNGAKVKIPVNVTLTRSNTYYDYEVKYGSYKADEAVYQACVMPTLEVKNGELIINGFQSNEYKYKVDGSDNSYTISKNSEGKYLLLVNGKPIYATNNDGTTRNTPYEISIPSYTTTVTYNNSPQFIFGAINTDINIFEVYGKQNDLGYYLTDVDGKEITYNPITGIYYVNGVESDFNFVNVGSEGFKNYLDFDDEDIDVLYGDKYLMVTAENRDSTFRLKASDKTFICGGNATIDNKNYAPTIEVSTEGNYIIDGYYTHYTASSSTLNPQINSNNYLILGDVQTDYLVSANNVTTSSSGIVQELSVYNKIFLLMLCLLAVPVMKLFKGFVPWVKKQAQVLLKIIGKI